MPAFSLQRCISLIETSQAGAHLLVHLQDVQVLAIAASAAATGLAAQAVAERHSVLVDFGSLAEDILAVQDSLQVFSQADEGPEEAPARTSASQAVSLNSRERRSCRPSTAPPPATEWSSSCCSSISFNKGAAPCLSLVLAMLL